jgi:hypothetical protein
LVGSHREDAVNLEKARDRLAGEFSAVVSTETVAECLRDSAGRLADARIQTFVPVLAERIAREKLLAIAQAGRRS